MARRGPRLGALGLLGVILAAAPAAALDLGAEADDSLAALEALTWWSQAHAVTGYSSLALGAVAGTLALAAPDAQPWTPAAHWSAATLAGSSLLIGYLVHYDKMPLNNLDRGLNSDTLHVVMAIAGSALIAASVVPTRDDARTGLLLGGTLTLGLATIWEWE